MIYKLQRKFILVCAISIFLVIFLIFIAIAILSLSSMNRTLDTLTDSISQGEGRFPDFFEDRLPKPEEPKGHMGMDFITPETRFATRHFTVWLDESGEVTHCDTDFIYSVDEDTAKEYAAKAVDDGTSRGWISNFRYKVTEHKNGFTVVFVDGSTNRSVIIQFLAISALVLVLTSLVILLLIIVLSKRAMKPVAESYEKQKQFITDANHELKTPLTLILANLDIAESEVGQNEWLEDIRSEGVRMTELVNQLVALTRMDEEEQTVEHKDIALSEAVLDTVSDFKAFAESRGKRITLDVEENVTAVGDELLIRRLVGILMDNAVKYCDEGGEICVRLKRRRGVLLCVENTCSGIDGIELDRLFDRFYRSDKARTYAGGYGIGLSIAKAIAQKHKGDIKAYKKDSEHIGFKVTLK